MDTGQIPELRPKAQAEGESKKKVDEMVAKESNVCINK